MLNILFKVFTCNKLYNILHLNNQKHHTRLLRNSKLELLTEPSFKSRRFGHNKFNCIAPKFLN